LRRAALYLGEVAGRLVDELAAGTAPPADVDYFEERLVAGLRIYIAREARSARFFEVGLRRFPRRTLVVVHGNPGTTAF
jgi:hypothetical protein